MNNASFQMKEKICEFYCYKNNRKQNQLTIWLPWSILRARNYLESRSLTGEGGSLCSRKGGWDHEPETHHGRELEDAPSRGRG